MRPRILLQLQRPEILHPEKAMSTVTPFSAESFPAAAVPPAAFTLEQYEHMVACGAFSGKHEKNVELLWGRITPRPPIGPPHEDRTDYLGKWSIQVIGQEGIRVRNQNSIRLPSSPSAPEPDICWVRERDYSTRAPSPEDILLLIEVADSSLERDRGTKLAAYAQAGIQDYWIVNLIDHQVEIYRQPHGLEYTQKHVLKDSDSVSPLALPTITVTAMELLGKTAE